DGTRSVGKLVGISSDQVVTERWHWSREAVAWIRLAAAPEATPSPVLGVERTPAVPQATPSLPTPGPTEPQAQPTPSQQARPRPSSPVQACPPGQPLGGWIRLTSDDVHMRPQPCQGTQTLLARFELLPAPGAQPAPSAVAGVYRAQELTYDITY